MIDTYNVTIIERLSKGTSFCADFTFDHEPYGFIFIECKALQRILS